MDDIREYFNPLRYFSPDTTERLAWSIIGTVGIMILCLAIYPYLKSGVRRLEPITMFKINGWVRIVIALSVLFYPAVQFLHLVFHREVPYLGHDNNPTILEKSFY